MLVLTYSVVTGAGMSLAFVIGYATPQWFQRRRGLATGVASAGLGVGMVIVAPIASAFVASVGWRGAFHLLGISLGLTLVVAAALIADDPDRFDAADVEFPDGRPASNASYRDLLKTVRTVGRSPAFLLLFGGTR